MTTDKKKITIIVDHEMYSALVEYAKREGRSMNAQIVRELKEVLNTKSVRQSDSD